jgi:hypothetical protein
LAGAWVFGEYVRARRAYIAEFERRAVLAESELTGTLTVLLDDGTPAHTHDLGDGTLAIDLPRGREVLIHAGSRPDLVIASVAVSEPGAPWGLP